MHLLVRGGHITLSPLQPLLQLRLSLRVGRGCLSRALLVLLQGGHLLLQVNCALLLLRGSGLGLPHPLLHLLHLGAMVCGCRLLGGLEVQPQLLQPRLQPSLRGLLSLVQLPLQAAHMLLGHLQLRPLPGACGVGG